MQDLQHCIECVIKSTYQLVNLEEKEEEDLGALLKNSQFNDEGRINVTEVMEWCFKTQTVRDYFKVLEMAGPE